MNHDLIKIMEKISIQLQQSTPRFQIITDDSTGYLRKEDLMEICITNIWDRDGSEEALKDVYKKLGLQHIHPLLCTILHELGHRRTLKYIPFWIYRNNLKDKRKLKALVRDKLLNLYDANIFYRDLYVEKIADNWAYKAYQQNKEFLDEMNTCFYEIFPL